jgi:hypothetical protein
MENWSSENIPRDPSFVPGMVYKEKPHTAKKGVVAGLQPSAEFISTLGRGEEIRTIKVSLSYGVVGEGGLNYPGDCICLDPNHAYHFTLVVMATTD